MKLRKFIATVLALTLAAVSAMAQMTDEQIISTIKRGLAAGKTQTQIGAELMSKGVTASQAKRLMQSYKSSSQTDYSTFGTNSLKRSNSEVTRERDRVLDEDDQFRLDSLKRKRSKKDYLDELDEKYESMDKQKKLFDDKEMEDDELLYDEDEDTDFRRLKDKPLKKVIFGHDMFTSRRLSFEPNENSATPASYVLGPGDEVIIDIWGVNETAISEKISPEGRIFIPQIGPVALSGLTISQATSKLKSALSQKYSLSGSGAQSQMSVTLGNIRTIMVNVLGEVKTPGTYRLSSFTTILNSLYRAGGITPIGSLRSIQIVRDGRIVGIADIYKLIFDGQYSCDVSLKDGDAVIVPPYTGLVEVKGGFKRPMFYEVLPGEPVGNIIKYSGGFTSDAHSGELALERKDGSSLGIQTIKDIDFSLFGMQDGDIISAYMNKQKDNYSNRVEVKGSVLRPGFYAIGGDIATVRQLVERAGGLLDDAFLGRAQIIRENEDRSLKMVSMNIGELMDGKCEDVVLRRNDVLIIGNVNKIVQKGDLTISGYVQNPGDYEYADGMTIEDLIMIAGGVESGASTAVVSVSRRIFNPESLQASDTLAKVFDFSMKDGLFVSGDPEFVLQPYDIVAVRKSPTYNEQKRVRITGEVTFPGEYTLTSNDERLTDLFKRAGGETPNGYIIGAMLKRKISEDERNVRRNMVDLIKRGGATKVDSLKMEKLKVSNIYTIGINLEKAIAKPHGEYDVVLHDGDELIIPSMTNTVRVQGEVLYPNSVSYLAGKSVKYYIEQSGGFSNEAKRSKVYVVHMNGKVSVGMNAKVQPGCEIVVPSRPERAKMSVGEWLGLGTTAASITTMIATIANYVRK